MAPLAYRALLPIALDVSGGHRAAAIAPRDANVREDGSDLLVAHLREERRHAIRAGIASRHRRIAAVEGPFDAVRRPKGIHARVCPEWRISGDRAFAFVAVAFRIVLDVERGAPLQHTLLRSPAFGRPG